MPARLMRSLQKMKYSTITVLASLACCPGASRILRSSPLARALRQQVQQRQLCNERFGAAAGSAVVFALGVHFPCLKVVPEIGLQPLSDDAFFQARLQYRETCLDTPEEVAIHPVRAGKVYPFIAIVAEVKYSRVFQKASDHRAHLDVFR